METRVVAEQVEGGLGGVGLSCSRLTRRGGGGGAKSQQNTRGNPRRRSWQNLSSVRLSHTSTQKHNNPRTIEGRTRRHRWTEGVVDGRRGRNEWERNGKRRGSGPNPELCVFSHETPIFHLFHLLIPRWMVTAPLRFNGYIIILLNINLCIKMTHQTSSLDKYVFHHPRFIGLWTLIYFFFSFNLIDFYL